MLVVSDFGNAQIKMARDDGKYLVLPSRVAFPDPYDWHIVEERANGILPEAYAIVNGVPIVVGAEASSHTVAPLKQGAARYTRELYGHATMAVVAQLLRKSGEVQLFVSHAPRDVEYRKDQREALKGEWIVELGGQTRTYNVTRVRNFDEPLGGWANVTLTSEGTDYKSQEFGDGRVLVIDVGGFTTDVLGIRPGGNADYGVADSIQLGIDQVLADFVRAFRLTHRKMFKDSGMGIDDLSVRDAIRYCTISLGGNLYKCEAEVQGAVNRMVNDVVDSARRLAGGFLRWDYILLTGGGGALLYPHIFERFDDFNPEHVCLAANMDNMHLANVKGGLKLWRLGVAAGMIK